MRKRVDVEGDRSGRLSADAWNMTWKRANNRVLIYISVLAENLGRDPYRRRRYVVSSKSCPVWDTEM